MKKQMDETETGKRVSPDIEAVASQKARDKANAARWDLDVAVFLFAVLIIVIILLFEGISIGIVAPVALFGLCMVWLVGWRRGKQLYQRFYEEELRVMQMEIEMRGDGTLVNTLEERVQKALRERWR